MAGPAGSGSVDIIVDMASGDFGLDQLNFAESFDGMRIGWTGTFDQLAGYLAQV